MRPFVPDGDARETAAAGGSADRDLFVTETMAELSARQGRTADAAAIYRRLLGGGPAPDRRARWQARLAALEAAASTVGTPDAGGAKGPRESRPVAASAVPVEAPTGPLLQLPLLIRTPVRSGQIVYAEGRDLIVLAPVNPGAQLMADGHIHVYAALRGRAVAGVRGCAGAQIFCQRLEAELVGIDAAYVPADELPVEFLGRPARVWLEAGVCRLAGL
ncbi:MAG TPA: septum site-determining protein MinC [Polyangia bacterium]|jgi:septum formation inhibitor MinC|nr:septum site-determining protein MinC [Polyangia bacterium]